MTGKNRLKSTDMISAPIRYTFSAAKKFLFSAPKININITYA
jgi:hypothetical protein